tara:strand:+ start:5732 stop:6193 length:462 start_codon:yes stop_codon:yes gene_type:complete
MEQLDNLIALYANPEVMRYIGNGVRDAAQSKAMMEQLVAFWEKRGYSLGMVYEKETGQCIGRAGLCPWALDATAEDIEVGYALFPDYWGRGYATELTKACINWGFEQGGLTRIVGAAQPGHKISHKVLEKAGLRFVKDCDYAGTPTKYFVIEK